MQNILQISKEKNILTLTSSSFAGKENIKGINNLLSTIDNLINISHKNSLPKEFLLEISSLKPNQLLIKENTLSIILDIKRIDLYLDTIQGLIIQEQKLNQNTDKLIQVKDALLWIKSL